MTHAHTHRYVGLLLRYEISATNIGLIRYEDELRYLLNHQQLNHALPDCSDV